MPEPNQNSIQFAAEAIIDLARDLGVRIGVALVLWLATLKILEWIPSLTNRWTTWVALGVAFFATPIVIYILSTHRRA